MSMHQNGKAAVRGHFTKALVSALTTGAVNANGEVTTDRLKGYLRATVESLANAENQKQTVRFEDNFNGPTVILKTGRKKQVDAKIKFTVAGEYILHGPELQEIKKAPASSGEIWTIEGLGKGLHALRNITTETEKVFRIDLTKNPFTYEF